MVATLAAPPANVVPDAPAPSTRFVGIDVSKKKLDLVMLPGKKHAEVPNTKAGWAIVLKQLQRHRQPTTIVLEPTGSYHLGLTLMLTEAGWPVVTANPRQVRNFARALGKQAKTDPIDAWVLAQFAEKMTPSPRPLPTANERRLDVLIARRADVVKMRAQEKNREHVLPELVQASVATMIASCDTEIADLDARIAADVAADPQIREQVELLRTVPGIGPLIGPLLVARLPELARLNGKQLANLVGVAPLDQQSGTYRGHARIQGGRADVRSALFVGVTRACTCDPVFKARYEHLQHDLGKEKACAKIAIVRWLLGVLHAMVRDNVSWEQTRIVTSFVKEKKNT